VAGRSEKETATRLLDALNSALNAYGYTKISNDMRGIMEVRAASAWIQKTAEYGNSFGVKLTTDKIEFQKFLNQQEPAVVCENSAAAARDLLRVMTKISNSGVNSYCVSMTRKFALDGKSGAHQIFATILESGMVVYSDPTPYFKSDKAKANYNQIERSFIDCSLDKIGRELFWASHYIHNARVALLSFENDSIRRIKEGRPPFLQRYGSDNAQGDEEFGLTLTGGSAGPDGPDYGLWKFDWDLQRNKLLEVEKLYGLFIN
jgi:hypothetical protein